MSNSRFNKKNGTRNKCGALGPAGPVASAADGRTLTAAQTRESESAFAASSLCMTPPDMALESDPSKRKGSARGAGGRDEKSLRLGSFVWLGRRVRGPRGMGRAAESSRAMGQTSMISRGYKRCDNARVGSQIRGSTVEEATTTPPTRCSLQEDRAGQAVTVETIRKRSCRHCRKPKR